MNKRSDKEMTTSPRSDVNERIASFIQSSAVGTHLMQECAEQVLATRQGTGTGTGYDSVTTSTCSSLGSYGGFSAPSVTVTADTSAACPPGGTCKTVAISVSKSGSSLAPITLELVSY